MGRAFYALCIVSMVEALSVRCHEIGNGMMILFNEKHYIQLCILEQIAAYITLTMSCAVILSSKFELTARVHYSLDLKNTRLSHLCSNYNDIHIKYLLKKCRGIVEIIVIGLFGFLSNEMMQY